MKRKTRIIQISGLRGLILAVFIVCCLGAGFILFPGIVAMKVWNFTASYIALPLINVYQGLLLWAIIAMSIFIINDRKKFLVALKTPDRLSESEMKLLLERMKIQSRVQTINSMLLKSGDIKSVDKNVSKSDEKSDKEKENI